jgi:hypothetical protein
MTTITHGVIPYNVETQTPYINCVGTSEGEASVNLDLIDLSDEMLLQVKFLPCEIHYDKPPTEELTHE